MRTRLLTVFLVAAFVISGCGPLAEAAGYVPEEEVNAAESALAEAELALERANVRIEELTRGKERAQSDLRNAESQLAAAKEELRGYRSLICGDHDWAEVQRVMIFKYLAQYEGVPEFLFNSILVTEWKLIGNVNLENPFDVLLYDIDGANSMAVSTFDDCIIVNPAVFPFFRD